MNLQESELTETYLLTFIIKLEILFYFRLKISLNLQHKILAVSPAGLREIETWKSQLNVLVADGERFLVASFDGGLLRACSTERC